MSCCPLATLGITAGLRLLKAGAVGHSGAAAACALPHVGVAGGHQPVASGCADDGATSNRRSLPIEGKDEQRLGFLVVVLRHEDQQGLTTHDAPADPPPEALNRKFLTAPETAQRTLSS